MGILLKKVKKEKLKLKTFTKEMKGCLSLEKSAMKEWRQIPNSIISQPVRVKMMRAFPHTISTKINYWILRTMIRMSHRMKRKKKRIKPVSFN